jgi:hypothetical protein
VPHAGRTTTAGGRKQTHHSPAPSAEEAERLAARGITVVDGPVAALEVTDDTLAGLFARLAAAVAPGGTLLIVGHHPSDLRTTAHRLHFPDMMFTAQQVASSLDPAEWEVLAAEARPRAAVDPDGQDITIHDAVLVARRRT